MRRTRTDTPTTTGLRYGNPSDIQVVRDRKTSETFHMENWLSALNQLRST